MYLEDGRTDYADWKCPYVGIPECRVCVGVRKWNDTDTGKRINHKVPLDSRCTNHKKRKKCEHCGLSGHQGRGKKKCLFFDEKYEEPKEGIFFSKFKQPSEPEGDKVRCYKTPVESILHTERAKRTTAGLPPYVKKPFTDLELRMLRGVDDGVMKLSGICTIVMTMASRLLDLYVREAWKGRKKRESGGQEVGEQNQEEEEDVDENEEPSAEVIVEPAQEAAEEPIDGGVEESSDEEYLPSSDEEEEYVEPSQDESVESNQEAVVVPREEYPLPAELEKDFIELCFRVVKGDPSNPREIDASTEKGRKRVIARDLRVVMFQGLKKLSEPMSQPIKESGLIPEVRSVVGRHAMIEPGENSRVPVKRALEYAAITMATNLKIMFMTSTTDSSKDTSGRSSKNDH